MGRSKIIVTFITLMTFSSLIGQHLDSVQKDLKHLSNIAFFKKYSYYDGPPNKEEMKVIKLLWSLHDLRSSYNYLRKKGTRTITIIDNKPTKTSPYYLIGQYQVLTETDHMHHMADYKVYIHSHAIYYQSFGDFDTGKWKRVY